MGVMGLRHPHFALVWTAMFCTLHCTIVLTCYCCSVVYRTMADDLYDEFGNYVGPELDGDSGSDLSSDGEQEWPDDQFGGAMDDEGMTSLEPEMEQKMQIVDYDPNQARAVVLHEDKNYYPDAEDLYPEAEVLVGDEDTQPLETPIVAPIVAKAFALTEKKLPETTFDYKFLAGLMDHPTLVRNLCLIGHLHHGKTSFMDLLVQQVMIA